MTYALALALIIAGLHLALRLQRQKDVEMLRRHACQEGIRQEWTMHPWEAGVVPTTDRPVGKPLRLVSNRQPVMFRKVGR